MSFTDTVGRMLESRKRDAAQLRDAICPTCSRPVDSNAARCPSCGRDLQRQAYPKAKDEPQTAIDPAGVDRAHEEIGLFAAARERVREAFVATRLAEEAVSAAFSRMGKTISADTASKIQSAIDALGDAQSLHAHATKALQTLVAMSMGDPPEITGPLPDQGPPQGEKKNMERLAVIAGAARRSRAINEEAIAIWRAQLNAAGTRSERADFQTGIKNALVKLHTLQQAYEDACQAIDFMADMQATAVDPDEVTGAGAGVPDHLKNATGTATSKLPSGPVTGTKPKQSTGNVRFLDAHKVRPLPS